MQVPWLSERQQLYCLPTAVLLAQPQRIFFRPTVPPASPIDYPATKRRRRRKMYGAGQAAVRRRRGSETMWAPAGVPTSCGVDMALGRADCARMPGMNSISLQSWVLSRGIRSHRTISWPGQRHTSTRSRSRPSNGSIDPGSWNAASTPFPATMVCNTRLAKHSVRYLS